MKRNLSLIHTIPLLMVIACGKENIATTVPVPSDPVVSPDSKDEVKLSFALLPADAAQCLEGGTLIATFEDDNRNNVLDDGENIISSSVVCNGSSGQNGKDGLGAGILVTNAPVASCPAGGSILKTYVDANNNSLLDPEESVSSTTTLCNGTDGSNGANGSSAYLSVAQASPEQCAAGGVVYTSSQAGQANPDISVICNGEAGHSAEFSMGVVGSMVANKNYSACYHDYLYIPNSLDPERGWLTFRHQSNGSQDRGIGNTGFQIWNVDIPHFSLASEVGNEVFCTLNWNATSKVLEYSVTSNRDGLSGETGSIHLQD